ncbi:glucan endo-1,3-beta-glucosidase A1 [Naviculisporaceae sp. PSN 640]
MIRLLSLLALTRIALVGAFPATSPISNNVQDLRRRDSNVPKPSGYTKQLFLEDFSKYNPGSQPSSDTWTTDTGYGYPGGPLHWGTNEVERYDADPRNLIITKDRTLLITPVYLEGEKIWTSARIETNAAHDFGCDAGKKILIEANIKLRSSPGNAGLGIWPAFWSMGSDFRQGSDKWPSVGEIDILESVNGRGKIWHTVHCGVAPDGPCHEKTGVGNQGDTDLTRDVWHTVGVRIDRTNAGGNWRGEKITWVVDGADTFTLDGSAVEDETAWVALTRNKKFILLNVAVGGDLPNVEAHTATPTAETRGGENAAMEVQWVAVWST